MKTLLYVLKKNSVAVILFLIIAVADFSIFKLYNIFIEPFVYALCLAFIFLLILILIDFFKVKKKCSEVKRAREALLTDVSGLPEADSPMETDYLEMIKILRERINRLHEENITQKKDAEDYYTAWVHQIKTPIAVMKLKLTEDTAEGRALSAELFRIEQYADMVLQYVRLGSETNDLVVREYPIDEIIKESVRKFAPQFVEKKLRLDYAPTDEIIVTDKKWFSLILEQFISNSLKYTSEGEISIKVQDNKLTVTDTGIGIDSEDLPRIFEKGYTGNNGRIGEKSSGLGLHLAKKAADMLSLKISAQSRVGEGSTFTINYFKE